jgi:Ca-activated chloride channel homolog
VLVDTSNSIRERFRFEQEAASEFVKSVIKTKLDKGMVVSFDTQPDLAADLMEDTGVLEKAIRGLRPGGGTALYDAIYFACKDKLQRDQPSTKYRRAIVMRSDGDDNNSRYTRDQALEMAQKADAVIYAISTNLSKIESDGDKVLKYLTAETGGRAFFPFKVEDLEVSFENLATELRHQYSLAYRPEPLIADGLFHPIDLRVKGRKDVIVHARRGYYAPKK